MQNIFQEQEQQQEQEHTSIQSLFTAENRRSPVTLPVNMAKTIIVTGASRGGHQTRHRLCN